MEPAQVLRLQAANGKPASAPAGACPCAHHQGSWVTCRPGSGPQAAHMLSWHALLLRLHSSLPTEPSVWTECTIMRRPDGLTEVLGSEAGNSTSVACVLASPVPCDMAKAAQAPIQIVYAQGMQMQLFWLHDLLELSNGTDQGNAADQVQAAHVVAALQLWGCSAANAADAGSFSMLYATCSLCKVPAACAAAEVGKLQGVCRLSMQYTCRTLHTCCSHFL